MGLESRSGGAGSGSSPNGGVGAGAGGTANQSIPMISMGIAGLGLLLGVAGVVTLRRSRRVDTD